MAGVERDGGDDDDVLDGVGGEMLVLVGVDVVVRGGEGGVEVGVGRVVDCVLLV
jgi:hypothetical protein